MRIVAGILLSMFVALFGQQSTGSGVHIKFVDDQTGFAVSPSLVRMDVSFIADTERGAGTVHVADSVRGKYLRVEAKGYRPISFFVAKEDRDVQIRLSPVAPPPEFSAESLAKLVAARFIAIVGFVSDEASGTALSGVRVASSELNVSSETNNRGFFALTAPEPRGYSSETALLIDVTFEKKGYRTLVRKGARVASGSVRKYRVNLQAGAGTQTIIEQHRDGEPTESAPERPLGKMGPAVTAHLSPKLPSTVRVGRNCGTSTTCTSVDVVGLEDYTKHVLPNEWFASWHAESLKSGSVAIRSVGTWYTVHPKTGTYDVCDTTACQVYDPDVSDQATDTATDATLKTVLVEKGTDVVAKAEYAAENNNAGCGDGKSGTGTSWPCIDDSVCKGKPKDGHGRGMCQNGSNRWANGKNADGSAAPGGAQDMDWILTHYYPAFEKTQGVE